jgi:hypothetical protein
LRLGPLVFVAQPNAGHVVLLRGEEGVLPEQELVQDRFRGSLTLSTR